MRNAFSRNTTQAIAGKGLNALRSEASAAQSIMGPHLLPAARFAMDDGLRNGSPFFENLELLKLSNGVLRGSLVEALSHYSRIGNAMMHRPSIRIAHAAALAGAVIWCAAIVVLRPSPFEPIWARAALLFAALVLTPLALPLIDNAGTLAGRITLVMQLPAALLLGWAMLLPQGSVAGGLSLAWLLTTTGIALAGLERLWMHRRGPVREVCIDVGMIYLAIGGSWAVLDRWGVRPLGFEAIIVLLTAIHFHYAGFLLPVLTGLALRRQETSSSRCGAIAAVVSVPLVAAGITATQLRLGHATETGAAWLMAAAGLSTAFLYIRLASRRTPLAARGLWLLAALSLAFGMVLAALYGSRFLLPMPWLDIPWMRALHGTANAFGFGLAGVLGWHLLGEPGASATGGTALFARQESNFQVGS